MNANESYIREQPNTGMIVCNENEDQNGINFEERLHWNYSRNYVFNHRFNDRVDYGFNDGVDYRFNDRVDYGFNNRVDYGFNDGVDYRFNDRVDYGFNDGVVDRFNDRVDYGFNDGVVDRFNDGVVDRFNDRVDYGFNDGVDYGFNNRVDYGFNDGVVDRYNDRVDYGFNDGVVDRFNNRVDYGFNDGVNTEINYDTVDYGFNDRVNNEIRSYKLYFQHHISDINFNLLHELKKQDKLQQNCKSVINYFQSNDHSSYYFLMSVNENDLLKSLIEFHNDYIMTVSIKNRKCVNFCTLCGRFVGKNCRNYTTNDGATGHFNSNHSDVSFNSEQYNTIMNNSFEIYRYVQVLFIDSCLMNVSHKEIHLKDFIYNLNNYCIDFKNEKIYELKYSVLNKLKERLFDKLIKLTLNLDEKKDVLEDNKDIDYSTIKFDDENLITALYISKKIHQNECEEVKEFMKQYDDEKKKNLLSYAITLLMGAYRLTKSQIDMMNHVMNTMLGIEECKMNVSCSYASAFKFWKLSLNSNKNMIKCLADNAKFISISMDLSSPNQTAIIGIVIRFIIGTKIITKMWILNNFTERENAKNLAQYVIKEFNEYGIDIKKFVSMTTDGARTNAGKYNGAAVQLQKYMYINYNIQLHFNYCLNHRQNLCLETVIGKDFLNKPHKFYLVIVNLFQTQHIVKDYNSYCIVKNIKFCPVVNITRWEYSDLVLQYVLDHINDIINYLKTEEIGKSYFITQYSKISKYNFDELIERTLNCPNFISVLLFMKCISNEAIFVISSTESSNCFLGDSYLLILKHISDMFQMKEFLNCKITFQLNNVPSFIYSFGDFFIYLMLNKCNYNNIIVKILDGYINCLIKEYLDFTGIDQPNSKEMETIDCFKTFIDKFIKRNITNECFQMFLKCNYSFFKNYVTLPEYVFKEDEKKVKDYWKYFVIQSTSSGVERLFSFRSNQFQYNISAQTLEGKMCCSDNIKCAGIDFVDCVENDKIFENHIEILKRMLFDELKKHGFKFEDLTEYLFNKVQWTD